MESKQREGAQSTRAGTGASGAKVAHGRLVDMFGVEVVVSKFVQPKSGRKPTPKRGYAAPPGTGPKDQTCKTCKHLFRNVMAKTYLKCELRRAHWTGGAGSDVLAKAPACRFWEAPETAGEGGV